MDNFFSEKEIKKSKSNGVVGILIFLFLVVGGLLFYLSRYSTSNDEKKELINSIMSYDNSYSYDFLDYIYNEYGYKIITSINDEYVNNTYDYNKWHSFTGNTLKVLYDNYNDVYKDNDSIKIIDKKGDITLSFVGDVSLADNFDIMPYYDERNIGIEGILSKEVIDIMKNSDIMVANNEFTISNRGTPLDKLYTFRASPERLNIYKEMGVNLVSTANNHIYDYGEEAFLDTLKYLKEYDIPNVGAGTNIDEAKAAFYYIVNGYKIAFISSTRAEKNIKTPGATSNTGGTFRCYDNTLLKETIKEEKEKADYVVLLIHWGREDSHELEDVMISSGKEYIDSGADLIVGSHAHYLQGMDFYKDKLIAYNLGDFIFNRETKDTGILSVKIDKDGKMSYYFIPCKQDNYKTSMLNGDDRLRVINDMNTYSLNAIIKNDGSINIKS